MHEHAGKCIAPLSKNPAFCCVCGSSFAQQERKVVDLSPPLHRCSHAYSNRIQMQPGHGRGCKSPAMLSSALSAMKPFILILTANVIGGSDDFLGRVMPASSYVVLKPLLDPPMRGERVGESVGLNVTMGGDSSELLDMLSGHRAGPHSGSLLLNSADVLAALRKHSGLWQKVFINHPLGYPQGFLSELFSLNKRYLSVTHDFYWYLKAPQPSFAMLRAFEGSPRNAVTRDLLPQLELKTQTAGNLPVFSMISPPPRSLRVIPLPDFVIGSAAAATRSIKARRRLLIGCIGGISRIKGSALLVEMARHAEVFVFGAIDGEAHASLVANMRETGQVKNPPLKVVPYATPAELNQLLERERPNVLVFPALWPETYSYTLTLAMQTRLPLIVRRNASTDFDFAVSHRLAKYPNHHFHPFDDMSAVVKLAQRIQASELYPVGTELHVQPQWAQLLHPVLRNVVLVGSKIVTSATPLSYFASRSRFSAETRFQQTLETLASIRAKVPHSYIVLIDNSDLRAAATRAGNRTTDWEEALRAQSDLFLNDRHDETLRYWTDDVDVKALGEALLLQQGIDAVDRAEVVYGSLLKLSGRYTLNEHFDWEVFDNEYSVFKVATAGDSMKMADKAGRYTYTSFYKIHERHVPWFRAFLERTIQDLQQMIEKGVPTWLWGDVELHLAAYMEQQAGPGQMHYVSRLGVTQRVGPFAVVDVDI